MGYEYMRFLFNFDSLIALNGLSREGWRVVSVQDSKDQKYPYCALMERPLPYPV